MRSNLLLFFLFPILAFAQPDTEEVVVKGKVFTNDAARAYYDLMIVNKRTHSGRFGNADGSFLLNAMPGDTLLFGAIGLRTESVAIPLDAHDTVRLEVRLKDLRVKLQTVEILPERTLKEIQGDIQSLGYNERDYRIYGVDALQSPITFLYQAFSKRERSKRKLAELINEERRRELLKELLHLYVEYDIINLSNESFDEFIDFINIPDDRLTRLSQYEFLMYVKRRYELYTRLGPTRRN